MTLASRSFLKRSGLACTLVATHLLGGLSGCALVHDKHSLHSALGYENDEPTLSDLPVQPLPTHSPNANEATTTKTNGEEHFQENGDTLSNVITAYSQVLAATPSDHALRPTLLEKLADYYLTQSENAMADEQWELASQSAREAARLYDELTQSPAHQTANALYKNAKAWNYAGGIGQSATKLQQLVANNPYHTLSTESWFRIGEYQFSQNNYAAASQAYSKVTEQMAGRDKENNGLFYQQSLYKLGWAQFLNNESPTALQTFQTLLTALDQGQAAPDHRLRGDAQRATTIIAAATNNHRTLHEALAGQSMTRKEQQYLDLANFYLERDEWAQAADTLSAFVSQYPERSRSPQHLEQAIEWYQEAGASDAARTQAELFVMLFGPTSKPWRKANHSPQWFDYTQTTVENLSNHYHLYSRQNPNSNGFDKASQYYQLHLSHFPNSEKRPEFVQRYGELLVDNNQHAKAINHLEQYAYSTNTQTSSDDQGTQRAQWAYLALEARQSARNLATTPSPSQITSDLKASEQFVRTFKDPPNRTSVAIQALELSLTTTQYPQIVASADAALSTPLSSSQRSYALQAKANAQFDQGDFARAAKTYAMAGLSAEKNPELVLAQAEAEYQLALKALKSDPTPETTTRAIHHLTRAEQLNPTGTIGQSALSNRIALHQREQQWAPLAKALQTKQQRFGLQANDWLLLAQAHQQANQPLAAAMTYQTISRQSDEFDTSTRQSSALAAAQEFKKANRADNVITNLTYLTESFSLDLTEQLTHYESLIALTAQQHSEQAANQWRQKAIAAWRANEASRTTQGRAIVANAQYELAKTEINQFERIKLRQPLQQSITRKKRAMENAHQALLQTASLGEPDTAAKATRASGDLFRAMAQDILQSQRPKGLDADTREEYDLILEEQALPFEDRAIQIHQLNAERAWSGQWNAAIEESFDALAELYPARFNKQEQWTP